VNLPAVDGIHQFLASLAYGDPQGNHALNLRTLLRRAGPSSVFFENCDSQMEAEGSYFWAYPEQAHAGRFAAVYHLAIGSPVADFLAMRDEPLLIDYHDLTPPEYFAAYDPISTDLVEQGRWQLESLADRASFAWAHSESARGDLEKAGYTDTAVLPLLIDLSSFERPPDPRTLRWLRETKGDGPDILFVGRIAPNKCQQDLIKLVRMYGELFGRAARLFCVGPISSRLARYVGFIREFAADLGVKDRVLLTDKVTLAQLRAYYASCDVFVSMSEHEGFCMPLVEAMHVGLPVVAYGSSAVPETVEYGGVLLPTKDLVEFAVAVNRIHSDESVRESLRAAARRRAADFSFDSVIREYARVLQLS
jgi:glycosyltransferase involved in cell wall biosynthesis